MIGRLYLPLALCLALAGLPRPLHADDDTSAERLLSKQPTWQAPAASKVRDELRAFLDARQVAADVRQPIEAAWAGADTWTDASETFERLTAALALADPRAKELLDLCARKRDQIVLPSFAWLTDEATPAIERHNLRLLYGRWLAQERLVDEALDQLDGLAPDEVADPAGLLFYQAVVYHQMLKKTPGLAAINRLLERERELPRRYASVAKLMQADLEPLKDDSLDHIARRMDDIRRRLDLGRAGPKVREVEDGVIKSLDKLIEEMEKQAAEMAAKAAGAGGGGTRSSSPAPDSVPLQGKGPGNVTHKRLGDTGGWGDLPPKDRQEALQQIGKDFPAHYRDMIEQYFRKLASEDSDK